MVLKPMSGDVDTSADPDVTVFFQVVQESPQSQESPRSPQQSTVHADAHHAGGVGTLGVEQIEAITQVFEERLSVRVALGQREPHVVAVQAVGNNELLLGCAT